MAKSEDQGKSLASQANEPLTAWRYMSLEKFRKLLSSKALYFCPIRRFIDQYEGFIHHDLMEELFRLMSPIVGGEERVVWTVENARFHILDSCFVSCWTYWDDEQMRLWDEYAGKGPGVALRTKVESLDKALSRGLGSPLICKAVWYSDNAAGSGNRLHAPAFRGDPREWSPYKMMFFSEANLRTPDVLQHLRDYRFIFTKRSEFAHEREFRIVLTKGHHVDFDQWQCLIQSLGVEYGTCGALQEFYIETESQIQDIRRSTPPEGVLVPFDLSVLDEIRVSPHAPAAFLGDLKRELEGYALQDICVARSALWKA